MPPDVNLGTASDRLPQEPASGRVTPVGPPLLRMIEHPNAPLRLNGGAQSLLSLYEQTIVFNESRVALVTPGRLGELSMLHSFAAVNRIETCDRDQLTTILFPWSRSEAMYQQRVVVNRTMLCDKIGRALHRLDGRPPTPRDSYIIAVNSLNEATKNDALREKLQSDPAA